MRVGWGWSEIVLFRIVPGNIDDCKLAWSEFVMYKLCSSIYTECIQRD